MNRLLFKLNNLSNIEYNLKESERLLNIVQEKFDKVNGINKKIDIKVKEVQIKSDNINIEVLNNQNQNNQIINEIYKIDEIGTKDVINKIDLITQFDK